MEGSDIPVWMEADIFFRFSCISWFIAGLLIISPSTQIQIDADLFMKYKDTKSPGSKEPGLNKKSAVTYSPTKTAVPSALVGLTSLFGMGRGGTPPQ